MIKVRYDETTKEITGWRGTEDRFDSLMERAGQATVILDIPIPEKGKDSYLYDNGLIANPSYVEPKPSRDLSVEIDELKSKITELEDRSVK